MPRLVELFSGTGSISKVFRAAGWDCVTVDVDPKANPDVCIDVLQLQPEMIDPPPDVCWMSPPCTMFSKARTRAKTPRDLDGADAFVRKALDLVQAWQCAWFMENPYTGYLKTRAVVAGIPYRIVDYCQWTDERWPRAYRKPTAIWTNTTWQPSKARCNRKICPCVDEHGRHRERVRFEDCGYHGSYAIPPLLCEDVFQFCQVALAVR
jgi:hypothetical protein